MHKRLFSVLYLQTLPEARNLETPPEFFNKKNYRVDKVRHYKEANACLDSRTYDIFLVDLSNISIGECLGLIQKARSLDICIFMVSDHINKKWFHNAQNLGVSGFFNKPIDPIMIENVAGDCAKSKSSKFPVGRESKSHRQNGPQKVESRVAVV